MSLVDRLLGRLTRKYDRTPDAVLALRLSYSGGSMVWTIADDTLTTAVVGGMGSNLSVDLTQYTLNTLAIFLAGQPGYSVLYLDQTGYANQGAIALVDGSKDITSTNGDHILVARNPNWAYMNAAAKELSLARIAIQAAPAEMSTTTADGEWLDVLGSYYGVPRELDEQDETYSPRIPAEVILPRQNNTAIELALQAATGQIGVCTDAVVYGNPLPIFDGSIAFDGRHFFNASAARIYNLFDLVIGYALEGNQTPNDYLTTIRAQVDRLRAAGTHLRNLTLGPSVMVDTAPYPTDDLVENVNVPSFLVVDPITTVSTDFATADFDSFRSAGAVSTDSAIGTLQTGSVLPTVQLAGSGSFTARPVVIRVARASLAGSGGFSILLPFFAQASAHLAGSGGFTADTLLPRQYASAFMAAFGGFTAVPQQLRTAGPQQMAGSGSWTFTPSVFRVGRGTMAGSGGFSVSTQQIWAARAILHGAGSFSFNNNPFSSDFSSDFGAGP